MKSTETMAARDARKRSVSIAPSFFKGHRKGSTPAEAVSAAGERVAGGLVRSLSGLDTSLLECPMTNPGRFNLPLLSAIRKKDGF
jgi:hypothetical protein